MDFSPIDDNGNTSGEEFSAGGKKVICTHCGSAGFSIGSAKLNTTMLTFFNLDWLNRSATILICNNCKKIQWFLEEPERLGEEQG